MSKREREEVGGVLGREEEGREGVAAGGYPEGAVGASVGEIFV